MIEQNEERIIHILRLNGGFHILKFIHMFELC
jgi:hypothetical protein